MKDIEIRKALIKHFLTLNEFSGKPFIMENNANVALPNQNFVIPENNVFFKLSFNPSEPDNIGMYNCEQQRYYGFFQIDICVQKNKGLADADNRFKWICKLFKEGSSFDGVDVEKVYRATTDEEENIYRTVVRVNFSADVINE